MKGLMVTLLVVLGTGPALAQQFGGNNFSADSTNRSAAQNTSRRTNQTRLQPLKRSFDNTSLRVAQSSSTDDGGFSPTSSQTIGGTNYKADSTPTASTPISSSDRNQTRGQGGSAVTGADRGQTMHMGLYGGPDDPFIQEQNRRNQPSSSSDDGGRGFTADRNPQARSNSVSSQSNNRLQAWPLPVSPQWEDLLKKEGYIYAPIKPEQRASIGEIVMFQDSSQFSNRSGRGSIVTSNKWDVYKNTAVIDIDDFDLREIQKGTLSLQDLGNGTLTGVALRYVRNDGSKISEQLIGNIPGNAPTNQVAARGDFGRTQTTSTRDQATSNRGNRFNERQFDTTRQREDSFTARAPRRDDRNDRIDYNSPARNTGDNGGWDVNDNQRVRQPRNNDTLVSSRQTYQRDDGFESQRDSRDRFADNNDRSYSSTSSRRLSDEYFDGLGRRETDDRDRRDADYVRNRLNENRGDDYLSRSVDYFSRNDDYLSRNDSRQRQDTRQRDSDDRYLRSNRSLNDGRSSDFDENFAAERRELQERLLAAERLEVKNAEDAAWVRHQREAIEQSRLASLYDDDLTPLTRTATLGRNSLTERRGYAEDRLADRSTDPIYTGRRVDALTPPANANASANRVAQILAEKEADLAAKMGAIDHLLKLDSAGRTLDAKINSIKQQSSQTNHTGRTVRSFVNETVPGTMGGNLASPNHPRLASNSHSTDYDGFNGGASALDINAGHNRGGNPRGDRGDRGYSDDAASGSSDGRMLRLMWLLLLISLGANFYLAMLSRSFYTQYEELADELRDTFSSSSTI